MNILFVTDFVCPYCIVAKEALWQALLELGLEAEIEIQPFELTEEPKERVDTFHDEKRRKGYQVLIEPAKELGLDMKLPPAVIPRPYTRLAFEGWYYAREKGLGEAYADAVYKAYFIEEQDIGQIEVLAGLAAAVGLEPEEFRKALEEGTYTQTQKEAVSYARETLQIRHVPTIYVDGTEVAFQTFQKEAWLQFFREQNVQSEEEIVSCRIDGCN